MARALLFSLLLLSAGCIGSVVPYQPGYQPRPAQETVEVEEQRVIRLAIPVEIEANEWHLAQGRREVGRIFAESARNPWNKYEEDVLTTLDDEHAKPILKDRYQPTKVRLSPKVQGPTAPTKQDEEGGGDEGGDDEE